MWRKGMLAGLACCALAAPAAALVEPEVEAWARMVGDARQACQLPGTELFAEGLESYRQRRGVPLDLVVAAVVAEKPRS